MDLRDLKMFLHLAESRHFGRSARAMHVSPSTLSRQIQRLEEDLGQPLFVRDNRTVTLAERVEAPVAAGQQLGTLTISANGETLAEIPIIAPEAIERLTWWELTCRLLRRLCMTMPEE